LFGRGWLAGGDGAEIVGGHVEAGASAGRPGHALTEFREKVKTMTDEELLTRLDELVPTGGGPDALVALGELDPKRSRELR